MSDVMPYEKSMGVLLVRCYQKKEDYIKFVI
jgi:hypothetical protein